MGNDIIRNMKEGKMKVKAKLFLVLTVLFLCVITISFCSCRRKFCYPPVTVVFRESLMNSSKRVMQVINQSEHEKIVAFARIRDKEGNERAKWTLIIDPGDTKEVGFWQTLINFDKGDTYAVSCDGYWGVLTGAVP